VLLGTRLEYKEGSKVIVGENVGRPLGKEVGFGIGIDDGKRVGNEDGIGDGTSVGRKDLDGT